MLIERERMRERFARHDLEAHRVRKREPLIGKPGEPLGSRVAEEVYRNGLPLVRRILDEARQGGQGRRRPTQVQQVVVKFAEDQRGAHVLATGGMMPPGQRGRAPVVLIA